MFRGETNKKHFLPFLEKRNFWQNLKIVNEKEREERKKTKDNRVTRNGREGEREGRNGSEKKMLVEERVDKGEKKRGGGG